MSRRGSSGERPSFSWWAAGILAHELARLGVVPASCRDAVRKAEEEGLLPRELGESLERAAGLRNVFVHLCQDLDMEILAASVDPALDDFGEFLKLFQKRLEEMEKEQTKGPG